MKSVSVFCGSNSGTDKIYLDTAYELGKILATAGIQIVYGGAKIGLMGQVAQGALDADGEVFGVIPKFLTSKEAAHEGLTDLYIVETMHERKTKMNDLSDAMIAMPGGFGTMEEFFEILTWGQLGLHTKPMGLLNIGRFYDPLVAQFESMVENGFLNTANRDMILVSDNIDDLIRLMQAYDPPKIEKWITPQKT